VSLVSPIGARAGAPEENKNEETLYACGGAAVGLPLGFTSELEPIIITKP